MNLLKFNLIFIPFLALCSLWLLTSRERYCATMHDDMSDHWRATTGEEDVPDNLLVRSPWFHTAFDVPILRERNRAVSHLFEVEHQPGARSSQVLNQIISKRGHLPRPDPCIGFKLSALMNCSNTSRLGGYEGHAESRLFDH